MNVLVLTSEPISAAQLREALGGALDPAQDAQVMVVAPALHEHRLEFWLSDADDAIAQADEVRRETVANLGGSGVSASGDTGESDPLEAIDDALKSFAADRIVLFAHPAGKQLYREEVDVEELTRRYGLPVDQATVSA
ncbi:MAG: hypothetical protein M3Z06_05385 [Actinomycetota bacterium]|nr:hypothetical protein [Actinomycetota bacterium]